MRIIFICIITLSSIFSSATPKQSNSLISESSPYLLQHAYNPINWYAWNQKTLQKAKDENKLIFLSIGYSTCHWCHVMEEETFSNAKLAKLFNKDYISIKVDRELMSPLDIYYQKILSLFKTQRNGWPLSVILTPSLEVLYITTYIPPTFNYGVAGIDTLLPKLANIYKDKKELTKLLEVNKKLLNKQLVYEKKDNKDLEQQYINAMGKVYDEGFKGFFKRPRFPLASNINLLYDIYDLTKNQKAKTMLYEPLTSMANGGIYDQVEGAFFRYSVYPDWIIPHFEKMLYTTAELVPLYVRAYNDTQNKLYKKVVVQSLEAIENRFIKDGLFYSASDADSNHKEGEYFVYDYLETYNKLLEEGYSKDEAVYNLEYLDIYEIGNFENSLSNIHLNNNDYEDDKEPKKLQQTLRILKQLRVKREYPFIDKKIITSWNAMMIKAYFKASRIDKTYQIKALKYLDALLLNLYIDNQLYHFKIGKNIPSQKAILEDYSFLIDTLLEAYQLTYNKKYLKFAQKFTKIALKEFYKDKTWYLSNSNIKVKADFNDKYYTSALGKMFHNLISVANFTYDMSLLYKTKQMIKDYENEIMSNITAHPEALRAIIRVNKGDIILKSNKNNLLSKIDNIKDIRYPFLLTSYEKSKDYLACDEKTCFAYDDDFDKIRDKILNKIGK